MTRIRGEGFSALPPQGKEWYIEYQEPDGVIFGKLFPDQRKSMMDEYHTFVAAVLVMAPVQVNAASEFPKAIEERFVSQLNEGSFRFRTVKTAAFGPHGSYCSQYNLVREERENPKSSRVILDITAHGFTCLDASSMFMIDGFYAERKAPGIESFLDDALKREAEGFLSNVVFTPLR